MQQMQGGQGAGGQAAPGADQAAPATGE